MSYNKSALFHSAERVKVEAALKNATAIELGGITNAEIANAFDIELNRVRLLTSQFVLLGMARSWRDNRQVRFAWLGERQAKTSAPDKPLRNGTTTDQWIAPRWELARPGAEDHKRCGSRRGDEVQEWKAPLSMCTGKGVERFMPDRLQR